MCVCVSEWVSEWVSECGCVWVWVEWRLLVCFLHDDRHQLCGGPLGLVALRATPSTARWCILPQHAHRYYVINITIDWNLLSKFKTSPTGSFLFQIPDFTLHHVSNFTLHQIQDCLRKCVFHELLLASAWHQLCRIWLYYRKVNVWCLCKISHRMPFIGHRRLK